MCVYYGKHIPRRVYRWQENFRYFQFVDRGRCGNNLIIIIFKTIIKKNTWGIRCVIALRWVPWNHTNDKSTLGQVMAWGLGQSRYMWMSHYGVTTPQWKVSSIFRHIDGVNENIYWKIGAQNLYNGPLPNDSETPVVCTCSVLHASFTCWHIYILPRDRNTIDNYSMRI